MSEESAIYYIHLLVFLMFVPISISISIFFPVTVFPIFSVFAITIIIAVFTLVHVNAVNQCTEVWEFMVFLQFVNQFVMALVGISGATNIHTQVGYTGNQLGIGYHTDRSRI